MVTLTKEQAEKAAEKLDNILRLSVKGRLGNARASLLDIGEEAKDVKMTLFGQGTDDGPEAA